MTTTNDSSFARPEFVNRIDYQISQMTSIDSIQETFLKDIEKINSKEGQVYFLCNSARLDSLA